MGDCIRYVSWNKEENELLTSIVDWCISILVLVVDICSFFKEHLDNFFVSSVNCKRQKKKITYKHRT